MLCRFSISLILVLFFISTGFCVEKRFIDAPTTCHVVEKTEGNKVYLRTDKNKLCIQALNKVTVMLPSDIKMVQIFVDGKFWKTQDLSKQEFEQLVDKQKTQEVEDKYSSLFQEKYIEEAKKYEKLKENMNLQEIQRLKSKQSNKEIDLKEVIKKKENDKVLSIFYLFSYSVPDTVLDTVFLSAKKLPKSVAFYGILRGIDKDKKILQKLTMLKNFEEIEIKIHPFIFRKLDTQRVPAIVFAKCPPSDIFEYEQCDWKYVLYGDISLVSALEIVSEKDIEIKKVYETVKNAF
ncbi:TrbC family F-type conjugative pilus assembly protein [Thermodesulfovibrio sp. TK110]